MHNESSCPDSIRQKSAWWQVWADLFVQQELEFEFQLVNCRAEFYFYQTQLVTTQLALITKWFMVPCFNDMYQSILSNSHGQCIPIKTNTIWNQKKTLNSTEILIPIIVYVVLFFPISSSSNQVKWAHQASRVFCHSSNLRVIRKQKVTMLSSLMSRVGFLVVKAAPRHVPRR